MRDDFTQKTKEKLAHTAGYKCSNPDCGISTRGASSDGEGTINIGVAAHITAASPEGPRYDSSLSSEERKADSNGLWLCENHGKLIDSDESHFTVEKLHSWKVLAMRRSFQEVDLSKPQPVGDTLADDGDVQTAVSLLLNYSKADIAAFQHMPGWPSHATIPLSLKLLHEDSMQVFEVTGLASGIDVYGEIAVVAPPGTGKTTTLLQLAEAILTKGTSVAVFVSLSEWSTRSDTFFQSLMRRAAFRNAMENQFELLAEHGSLVLILDGWNELDEASKKRARNDIKSLRRDFPNLRLVVSSRYMDFDIPIIGPVVEVEVLSEEQQLGVAQAIRGSEGEALMDHAWRTPGLRELIAIPLYLTTLLKQAPGDSLPTTKEEILRSFITELEQDPDKRATLREVLQGFHADYLKEIAVETTRQGSVALSETQARVVVNTVQNHLMGVNQIAQLYQPMKILDALASAHMLVRSGDESGGVSFQHQQFQEWFASFRVQQLMLSSASGDGDAQKMLREDVLDIPVWEEAVLFACDRLSQADERGVQAVSHAILEALGIDPLLSAEMIWRSSEEVWEQIRENVISFAERWHSTGCVDRAFKFMIDTGRAEFSQYVWPLISDPDDQVHLHALRAGKKFRPSVLGLDVQERIAALPAEVRKNVVSEIASNGGMEGIELATNLANNDEDSEVKRSVIESLLFRRANRFVTEILRTASDDVWRELAKMWHQKDFSDPEVSARIEKEAVELLAVETDPRQSLNRLLKQDYLDHETGAEVRELVGHINFSDRSQNDPWLIQRAYQLYPKDIIDALVSLLKIGKPVPFQIDELLRASNVIIDDGPLVGGVLQDTGDERIANAVACIIGPRTVGQLIDQVFELQFKMMGNTGRYDKALSDEYHRLIGLISRTKIDVFIQVLLERADTDVPDEIAELADLISRHGGGIERGRLKLSGEAREHATAAVQAWAKILLASPEATLSQFAEIATAVKRLESPELVPVLQGLLSEDLIRRKRAMEELLDARKNGIHIQNDAHMCWNLQYRDAFAAIGDERTVQIMKAYLPSHDFGIDAACALQAIWKKTQPVENESGRIRSWPDFSVVPDEFTKRQSGAEGETHVFVNDMLTVVDSLINSSGEESDCKHALKLATIALSMPYGDQSNVISSLLKLPLRATDKQDLLSALVLSGEVIPSEIVIQGIDDLIEEAEIHPWVLQDKDGWPLKSWLRLLPFTEDPNLILNVIDRLPSLQVQPWNLRELLSALKYSPSPEAENVLSELAKRDAHFLDEYDWLEALSTRNSLTASYILLDWICSASFFEKDSVSNRSFDYGKRLSHFMNSHEQFRQEVYRRFQTVTNEHSRSIIEYAMVNAPDADGMLLLVRVGAAHGQKFRDTGLYTALRDLLVEWRAIESSDFQESHRLPASELRQYLFDIVVNGNPDESQLATECLTEIDEIRDDYGCMDSEPRHPNLSIGTPWPITNLTELQESNK